MGLNNRPKDLNDFLAYCQVFAFVRSDEMALFFDMW